MGDPAKLKSIIDAYGVGVRAGVITPQVEDEKRFRDLFNLPDMSKAVADDWSQTNNVRKPITLQQAEQLEQELEGNDE